jgi:Mrp family chromosome partitioning ATPase
MTEQREVDPIACFLTACELERREHRSCRQEHKVVNGRRVYAEGGRFIYSFDALADLSLRDDSSIQLVVAGAFYHGTVVTRSWISRAEQSKHVHNASCQSVTIAIQADLGEEIVSARIEGEDQDLLQALIVRLRAIKDNERLGAWNRALADRVLALPKPEEQRSEPESVRNFSDDLTPDQTTALRRCLSQPVTYVWGPPGTGKTVVLAALALQLYQENKRVLIVSHTNHAVDGVVESLCKRITEKGRTAVPEGSILRVGTMVRESLIKQFGEQVHLESVMNRSHDKVSSRLEQLKRELSEVRDALFAVSRKMTLLDSHKQLLSELDKVRRELKSTDTSFVSAVKRVFQFDPPEPARRPQNSDGVNESVELLESSVQQISRELEGCDRVSLSEQSVELSTRQLEITEAIALLEKFVRDLRISLLDRARIIATTATHAMLSTKDLHTFDAVLIDEASMLPLPLCFLLSGQARERVIIAGDFRQLPAIAMSDSHMVRQWYSRDVFECAGVVDLVDSSQQHPALVTLTTQFRSHETLCSLINQRFYGGILQTKAASSSERMIFNDPLTYLNHSPVVLVDTAPLAPWGEARNRSKSNLMHALLVRKVALLLAGQGLALKPEALGVITPYRPQANLIRELFNESELGANVSVGTVHKFQGSERDVIIVDLTESFPHQAGNFFTASSLRETGARLLNVALSRAKRHLVVIGNFEYLRAKLSSRHVMWGVLDDLQRVGYQLPVDELIGEPIFATPPKEVCERSGVLAFQAFDEELFLPGLITDLLEAQHEVVFSSPSMSGRVAHVIKSIVEQRIQEGLRVTLWIGGSSGESKDEEAVLRGLKGAGVVLLRSPNPVPAGVVIDSEVVWLGSIAPFDSIAPVTGTMTRCVSQRAAHYALELMESGMDQPEPKKLLAFA